MTDVVYVNRFSLPWLLIALAMLSWPLMMGVHELGHIVGAWMTGGTVTRAVWYPLTFSRTEVFPNDHPLLVVWAGPVVGCGLPLLIERLMAWRLPRMAYLAQCVAGFCLIANGAYIGLGWIDDVGDAGDMLFFGTPVWVMIAFGFITFAGGLYLWHLASRRFGRDARKQGIMPIPRWHVVLVVASALLLNAVLLVFGDSGR